MSKWPWSMFGRISQLSIAKNRAKQLALEHGTLGYFADQFEVSILILTNAFLNALLE